MPDFLYEYLRFTSNGFLGSAHFFHPGNLDNQANQFQLDNAIKYESPTFAGFTFGTMNGFGEQPDDFNRAIPTALERASPAATCAQPRRTPCRTTAR